MHFNSSVTCCIRDIMGIQKVAWNESESPKKMMTTGESHRSSTGNVLEFEGVSTAEQNSISRCEASDEGRSVVKPHMNIQSNQSLIVSPSFRMINVPPMNQIWFLLVPTLELAFYLTRTAAVFSDTE